MKKQNKKLTILCGTQMKTKENQNKVINLSSANISEKIQQILNLGLNRYLNTKTTTIPSKIKMEKVT